MEHVTVFGGTGFLGRRIVAQLVTAGARVRVAARHPQGDMVPDGSAGRVEPVVADIREPDSVAAATAGARAVVNAVSLYVEHGDTTFEAIHVDAARRLAEAAQRGGAACFIQLSGIGADPESAYIRSRGRGEAAVRAACDRSVILRPSVMFGSDDAFLNTLLPLLRRLPVVPLFGQGDTKLQPVCVDDVAAAAVETLRNPEHAQPVYELGGPEIFTYRQLIEALAQRLERRPLLLPLPFALWRLLALPAAALPTPPITESQIALMRRDNVAADDLPGLAALNIAPTGLGTVLARDFGL